MDDIALLEVPAFLSRYKSVSLYIRGVRPIPKIEGSEILCDDKYGTDLLIRTEEDVYYLSHLMSDLLDEYYKAKILSK